MNQLPRHLLPRTLQLIADYCGEDVMWAVWQHYGGGRLHVPNNAEPGHPLRELLGPKDAAGLCAQFGGEMLSIPRAVAAQRAVRNALIRQLRAEGLDNFTLARRFNLTDRQIITICRTEADEAVNLDLFDD